MAKSKLIEATDADFAPLTVHPAAAKLPLMSRDEFALLVARIKRAGRLRRPVEVVGLKRDRHGRVTGGTLVGGRCRWLACKEAGVEPTFRELDDEYSLDGRRLDETEIAAIAFDDDVARRHLSIDARKAAVAELLRAEPATSDRAAAAKAGVSAGTAKDVRAELESAGEIQPQPTRKGKDGQRQPAAKGAQNAHLEPADDLGTPIPPHLRDAFAGSSNIAAAIATAGSALRALEAALMPLMADAATWLVDYEPYLIGRDVIDSLQGGIDTIRDGKGELERGRPYAVCRNGKGCGGDVGGCRRCEYKGWVPYHRYEALAAAGEW